MTKSALDATTQDFLRLLLLVLFLSSLWLSDTKVSASAP